MHFRRMHAHGQMRKIGIGKLFQEEHNYSSVWIRTISLTLKRGEWDVTWKGHYDRIEPKVVLVAIRVASLKNVPNPHMGSKK